jgi:cytochrome c-type biogenesis protein CcmF
MIGELCLLCAFVASGFAAFATLVGWLGSHGTLRRSGLVAAVGSVLALSVTLVVLAWALVAKDFSFRYVADYSSWLLAWYYSLAALWVGQAGSLLLWAWLLGILSLAYRFWRATKLSRLRDGTLGVLMVCLCFLTTLMVFGADPMESSVVVPTEGVGLGPLLHHPAMLVHPPIVFIGYAAWTIPFALAVAALVRRAGFQPADHEQTDWQAESVPHTMQAGSPPDAAGKLEADWVREARGWSLFAWTVLGVGILLGASWAYEELGWGGYWGWDPVENGSLIPWLTGSALIHALMTWRYRGVLKKTAVSLAIATFGMCNFATFLTRSGVFSSVHAFSQSPIGWMFLIFMGVLAVGGTALVLVRRRALAADSPIASIWTREAFILLSAVLLLLLAMVTTAGTVIVPVTKILFGRQITVGPAFYNNMLIPTGLLLLGLMALAPLLQWGRPPDLMKRAVLFSCFGLGIGAAAVGFGFGLRNPIALAVTAMAAVAVSAVLGSLLLDARRRAAIDPRRPVVRAIHGNRRQYAGFLVHMGFVCVAIGVTGSSLGTSRREAILDEGESIEWAGRTIRYERLVQRELPDKLVAEAVLHVTPASAPAFTLQPARHLHLLPNEWTTEVAVHSTWKGDFYTILNSGEGGGRVSLTLVDNPLMRFLWLGGGVIVLGTAFSLWPARTVRRAPRSHQRQTVRARERQLVPAG